MDIKYFPLLSGMVALMLVVALILAVFLARPAVPQSLSSAPTQRQTQNKDSVPALSTIVQTVDIPPAVRQSVDIVE